MPVAAITAHSTEPPGRLIVRRFCLLTFRRHDRALRIRPTGFHGFTVTLQDLDDWFTPARRTCLTSTLMLTITESAGGATYDAPRRALHP